MTVISLTVNQYYVGVSIMIRVANSQVRVKRKHFPSIFSVLARRQADRAMIVKLVNDDKKRNRLLNDMGIKGVTNETI